MPQFRTVADERRYNALRTEMYLRLATSGLPAVRVSEILSNLAKLESVLFWEGLRQGLAIAQISELNDDSMDIFGYAKAHAAVYGAACTPLTAVEDVYIERAEPDDEMKRDALRRMAWLDTSPMEFGPLTLSEAAAKYGPDLVVDDARPIPATRPPTVETEEPEPNDDDVEDVERMLSKVSLATAEPGAVIEEPDLLDRVRTHLLALVREGWKPANWQELVLRLHRELAIDAFALDLQLASEMGRTVLTQCGLLNLSPGLGVAQQPDGSFDVRY